MINFTPIHEIFSIGPFHIYVWGLIFVIAFAIMSYFVLKEANRKRIDQGFILNVLLLALLGILIGGRLFFVLENFSYFFNNLGEIFEFAKGGETSYGAFLGVLFVWLYCKFSKNKLKPRFSELLDLFAPYIALAAAITRIGCFLNWDDFGISSSLPWAINAGDGIARHPTQLYESVYCIGIFFILLGFRNIRDKGKLTRFRKLLNKKGALFLFFLLFYSFFRFFNDFLRIYEHYFLGLALSQWILILTFVISVVILIKKK